MQYLYRGSPIPICKTESRKNVWPFPASRVKIRMFSRSRKNPGDPCLPRMLCSERENHVSPEKAKKLQSCFRYKLQGILFTSLYSKWKNIHKIQQAKPNLFGAFILPLASVSSVTERELQRTDVIEQKAAVTVSSEFSITRMRWKALFLALLVS